MLLDRYYMTGGWKGALGRLFELDGPWIPKIKTDREDCVLVRRDGFPWWPHIWVSKCSGMCEVKKLKTSLGLKPSKSLDMPAGPENLGRNVLTGRHSKSMVSWCSKIQRFKGLLCWSQVCPPRNGTWLTNKAGTGPLFRNISGIFCWHVALALALGLGQVGRWAQSN